MGGHDPALAHEAVDLDDAVGGLGLRRLEGDGDEVAAVVEPIRLPVAREDGHGVVVEVERLGDPAGIVLGGHAGVDPEQRRPADPAGDVVEAVESLRPLAVEQRQA